VTVKVVQVIVPILLRVPEVYAAVLEQVKLNVAKSIVPAVIVNVVQLSAAANVVVPAPLLIINGPSVVLVLGVIVPVPTIVVVIVVYTAPTPLLNVNPFRFNEVVPGLNAVVPKFNVLNQLPVVRVVTNEPEPVNDKLGELVDVPPVVPTVTVLVTDVASVVNPPIPETVNPVAVAILKTVVAAVG